MEKSEGTPAKNKPLVASLFLAALSLTMAIIMRVVNPNTTLGLCILLSVPFSLFGYWILLRWETLERTSNGVLVETKIYNEQSKKIVFSENNRIHILTGENIHIESTGDLSTLKVVKDRPFGCSSKKEELLYIDYPDPITINVRGIFSCPGHMPVTVTNEAIIQDGVIRTRLKYEDVGIHFD